MSSELFRVDQGVEITSSDGNGQIYILTGDGIPGGDSGTQDDAPIGSVYTNTTSTTDNNQLFYKSSNTNNSSEDWEPAIHGIDFVPLPPTSAPSQLAPRVLFDSRGGGLLTNGTGILGDYDNPVVTGARTQYNFVGAYHPENVLHLSDGNKLDGVSTGFLTKGFCTIGNETNNQTNEPLMMNPNICYMGGGSVMCNADSAAGSTRLYAGHAFLDKNGFIIKSDHHEHRGLAKLAQDLNLGTDTWMYIVRDGEFQGSLDPHTEWKIGLGGANSYALRRGPIFWDHHYSSQLVDINGESIPLTKANDIGLIQNPAGFGYSRHMIYSLWDNTEEWEQANDGSGAGNWNGYTNVWRHPINTSGFVHHGHSFSPNSTSTVVLEGTWLSHNWHGGTYKYSYLGGSFINDEEKVFRYKGWIGGVDYTGKNYSYNFPPGAAAAQFMLLAGYGSGSNLNEEQYHSSHFVNIDESIYKTYKQRGAIPEHYHVTLKRMQSDGSLATAGVILKSKIKPQI